MSATDGFSKFALDANLSGSTAYALELQYVPLEDLAEFLDSRGPRVRLRAHGNRSASELAAALTAPGLARAEVDGDLVVATFDSEEGAAAAVSSQRIGFDLGPFELDQQDLDSGFVRLRSRAQTRIDAIEIVATRAGEEWRRLMARDVDVIPNSTLLNRARFDGMSTVRTVDLPAATYATLYFNTQDPTLQSRAVRRELAALLDRRALAAILCGQRACAAADDLQSGPHRSTTLSQDATGLDVPDTLELLTLDFEPWITAARHLRHQFGLVGIQVIIRALPVAEGIEVVTSGRHQLVLLTGPLGESFPKHLTSAGSTSLTNYRSPELLDAVRLDEAEHVRQILERDMPALPLYELREFAAIDSRFCGGQPKSATSWAWLAELYPCEEGP